MTIRLAADTTEAELLALIDQLNADPTIHGILVQMPLPKQIDTERVLHRIDPAKDVDGFHPDQRRQAAHRRSDGFAPCTPAGVQQMLIRERRRDQGRGRVVVGRSTIVGKPMATLLLQDKPGADCDRHGLPQPHAATSARITRRADILIAGDRASRSRDRATW